MVSWESLRELIVEDRRTQFSTGKQGKLFNATIDGEYLIITPLSTRDERRMPRSDFEKFASAHARLGSDRAADCQDVTFNASYYLAMIEEL